MRGSSFASQIQASLYSSQRRVRTAADPLREDGSHIRLRVQAVQAVQADMRVQQRQADQDPSAKMSSLPVRSRQLQQSSEQVQRDPNWYLFVSLYSILTIIAIKFAPFLCGCVKLLHRFTFFWNLISAF